MEKKKIFILVLLLVIGFAAISTSLVINGNINVGFSDTKFDGDIIFTKAESETGEATISETRKEIAYNAEKLENVGQRAILDFDVTNKNRNYDADVTITCGLESEFASYSDYVTISTDLESPFELNAGQTKSGHLIIEMTKLYGESLETEISYVCKLVATPKERETLGEEYKDIYKDTVLNGADPVLKDELIPVILADDGTVTYADLKDKWYNYENKEWANAVILNEGVSYNVGDTIPEDSIESYFVWIPRYRYQIFDEGNYSAESGTTKPATSIAKTINIEFESKDIEVSNGSTKDSWLTHPAFTNFDVNGLWIGKFETSKSGSQVQVKPNVVSWRNETVKSFFTTLKSYNTNLDSHMMKNTEWGAAAYLSHSVYGINTEVRINNNSNYLTGYSAVDGTDQSSYPGTYGTDSSVTLPYNTSTGYKASTTGNITGIYDMSGGAWEYMAAYMATGSSGFTASELTANAKYLDVYPSNSTITSYNNRILGDATGEMGPFYYYKDKDNNQRYHNNWYADDSLFVDSTNPWFFRGGNYDYGVLAGQFHFARDTGVAGSGGAARLVLAATN